MPTRYFQNPDVVVREEDADGALFFNPDTNQVKVINETGFFIWKLCDGSRSLGEIIDAVKDAFVAEPDENLESEVREFVAFLLDAQLLGIIMTSENEATN